MLMAEKLLPSISAAIVELGVSKHPEQRALSCIDIANNSHSENGNIYILKVLHFKDMNQKISTR